MLVLGGEIAKDKAVAFDYLAGCTDDRLCEDRSGVDEGVELPILATGIDARR